MNGCAPLSQPPREEGNPGVGPIVQSGKQRRLRADIPHTALFPGATSTNACEWCYCRCSPSHFSSQCDGPHPATLHSRMPVAVLLFDHVPRPRSRPLTFHILIASGSTANRAPNNRQSHTHTPPLLQFFPATSFAPDSPTNTQIYTGIDRRALTYAKIHGHTDTRRHTRTWTYTDTQTDTDMHGHTQTCTDIHRQTQTCTEGRRGRLATRRTSPNDNRI